MSTLIEPYEPFTRDNILTLSVMVEDNVIVINGYVIREEFPADMRPNYRALQWYGAQQIGHIEPAITDGQLDALRANPQPNSKSGPRGNIPVTAEDFPTVVQPIVDFYNAIAKARWDKLIEDYEQQEAEWNSPEAQAERVRQWKQNALSQTNFLMFPDAPLTDEERQQLLELRAAIWAIPNSVPMAKGAEGQTLMAGRVGEWFTGDKFMEMLLRTEEITKPRLPNPRQIFH